MKLAILSYFDRLKGPRIFFLAPESTDRQNLNHIPTLMDLDESGFLIHMTEEYRSANRIFTIPNPNARGGIETLEISIVIDIETNIDLNAVRKMLTDFSKRIIKINDCYKAFYYKPEEKENEPAYHQLKKVFMRFYKSIKPVIQALKDAENKLRESERRYRELVENVNSIILKWDFKGDIIFINSYGEKFFGFTREEIIGKNVLGTIVPISDKGGRNLKTLINEIKENPDKYEQNINENITKAGKKVKVSWTNRGLRDNEGNIIGILSVGNDFSEYKELNLN